jgi:hypothetical protein
VRRHLTGSEIIRILDIPDSLLDILTTRDRSELCHDKSVLPLKVVLRVLDSLPLPSSVPSLSNKRSRSSSLPAPPVLSSLDAQCSDDDTIITSNLSKTRLPSSATTPKDVDETCRNRKATKSDDAAVPEYLWNHQLVADDDPMFNHKVTSINILHSFCLRWWKWNLLKEFLSWFRAIHSCPITPSALVDLSAGCECISRAWNSSWWEWADGSRPFFWRWPLEYRHQIRDGHRLWIRGTLPRWLVPQRPKPDPQVRKQIRTKLCTVRQRGYIVSGPVLSLTSYFAVPKGDDDIRMVYDGTKSGLNSVLWAPWFPLPTIDMHLQSVVPGTFMGDLDIGEMFLNFLLHPRL